LIRPETDIYDALAPHYREYAEKRSAYLAAVDRFVLENLPAGAASLLDVGAGDGVRGMALGRQAGISRIVLCDSSAEMAARCRALGPAAVWDSPLEAIPAVVERFDVICCLWNVLGHLDGRERRLGALSRMKELLAANGVIFFDVNNRYNAPAYGWARVLGRIVIDTLSPDESRGDASFEWRIGERTYPAMGHLFVPAEIERLIAQAGLAVKSRLAIDYATGARSRWALRGQLAYMVGR
jgi:SAM-dependent methyltransferase